MDSQYTVDLFCNEMLLTNIRKVKYYLDVFCNAGSKMTNTIDNLEGYVEVW